MTGHARIHSESDVDVLGEARLAVQQNSLPADHHERQTALLQLDAMRAISRSNSGLDGESIQHPGQLEVGTDVILPAARKVRIQTTRVLPQPGEHGECLAKRHRAQHLPGVTLFERRHLRRA
jgi:hypothetical protein